MLFHDYRTMYMSRWKKATVILLLIWIIVAVLAISTMKCSGNNDDIIEFQDRLRKALLQLDTLKKQHQQLVSQIRRSSGFSGSFLRDIHEGTLFLDTGPVPPEEYENLRRRVSTNLKELWYFVNAELEQLIKSKDVNVAQLSMLKRLTAERKNSLLSDTGKLWELDGYAAWRQTEAANVSDLVQRRLYYLQNPPDCREARKLICNLNKGCGFGCQLHHLVYCLIFAYATERTLIVNSKGWRYNPKGWDYVFYPLSDTCTSAFDDKVHQWPVAFDAKVISLPFIDSLSKRPKFLPLAVPKDLAHRIIKFNGDPASWWIGQILKYILKPKPHLQSVINETISKMNFKGPIVGVHVRRTDKVGTEAAFHHISEYMGHVADYYDQLELTQEIERRTVYLASDDPNVLEDARRKYPDYTFLGDAAIAKTAATHRRYTPASLTGLLVDLHLLSMCDYLVCTFSSQVGRVAYQMMQANRVDASDSFFSLDDIYYYGGQNAHDRMSVMRHIATNNKDVNMEVGDLIGVAGNHWNGYGRGSNRRTNQLGLIPWYKTNDHLVLYPFPEYKTVPLNRERKDLQKDLLKDQQS